MELIIVFLIGIFFGFILTKLLLKKPKEPSNVNAVAGGTMTYVDGVLKSEGEQAN